MSFSEESYVVDSPHLWAKGCSFFFGRILRVIPPLRGARGCFFFLRQPLLHTVLQYSQNIVQTLFYVFFQKSNYFNSIKFQLLWSLISVHIEMVTPPYPPQGGNSLSSPSSALSPLSSTFCPQPFGTPNRSNSVAWVIFIS